MLNVFGRTRVYSFSNSLGKSGGIITLWKEDSVTVLNSFKGVGFLGIKVLWKNGIYYVFNIYSPCDLNKKIKLWKVLLDLKEKYEDEEWIIYGDFNSIKNSRERKGRSLVENIDETNAFVDFIGDCKLVDVPCIGKRLCWYNGDGKLMSTLD